jgi:hypothetical protein
VKVYTTATSAIVQGMHRVLWFFYLKEASLKTYRILPSVILFFLILGFKTTTDAHFGMVVPPDPMVMQGENRTVQVQCFFSHPFEMVGMDLQKPRALCVFPPVCFPMQRLWKDGGGFQP